MLEGIATLEEIDRSWSFKDLMDAHEALDLKSAMKAHFARIAAKKIEQARQQAGR